jgi:beta-N-acetylhexosaminidase
MTGNLRRAAGSLLVVGLSGTELTGLERAWLTLIRPGGVILFRRNITDVAQTRALLDEATSLCTAHSARYVDVEGGTVNRLRNALAPIPSAQAVATAMQRAGKPNFAREHGELIARAVKAFGFNTTLAPVVDLALPESAEVMGTRAPDAHPKFVVEYARGFLKGLAEQKVAGCGKHFPGLAGAASDTHFETPEIHRSWEQVWNDDLEPYRALRQEMPIVMMNHAAYPETPSKRIPASASPFWITTVLRKRIGYRGIILSDDLEMGGILKFMSVEEAAVAAIRAGSDLVEICHSAELILRSYEALIAEAERSAAFRKLLLTRASETARKQKKLYAGKIGAALNAKQLDVLRERILQFSYWVTASSEIASASVVAEARAAAPAEIS